MAAFADYEQYDALGLADLVRRGKVTPAELLEAAIARVDARNPTVNAVIMPLYDYARRAIADGLPDGPFRGVPFLLKDLGAPLTGVTMTRGSRFFADTPPSTFDSENVARLKRAGLVIFGRTNSCEVGLSLTCEPRLYGPTRNPWDPTRISSGSSGGAAAAVGARMLPMAHASDGFGSIRAPAASCGLVGLKPTRGRNTFAPVTGEGLGGCSTEHAVTLSVRDSAALLDATSGPDIGDPYCAPPLRGSFLAEVGADPGRLKIAFTTKAWNGSVVDPQCAEAAVAAAKLCESLGHHVEEASPALDEEARGKATYVIAAAHTRAALELRGKALGREATADDVETHTWRTAEHGREVTAAAYAQAIRVMHQVGRIIGRFFTRYDVLLTPTMCRPPHPLGVLAMTGTDPKAYLEAILGTIAFTSPFNTAGTPAMSVPLAWSKEGLPLGVHFAAGFDEEATLVRLAAQLEKAQPWAEKRARI
jgi:amidase